MQTGKIIKSISGFYDVATADGNVTRTRARGNFRKKKVKPIVGDIVDFENEYVLAIHKRKNEIVRPLIANVDQALIVISAVQPDFSDNLLDRFLVTLESQKIKPLIYLSKTDLLNDDQLSKLKKYQKYYQAIGYHFYFANEVHRHPQTLMNDLQSSETVLAGQTGAGKSTLLNYLIPDLNLETNEISASLNRGKHTTRQVTLYPYKSGLIADTPGFSSLDFNNISNIELPNLFVEFKRLSINCKFRSCLHINEPQCAVKAALKQGEILKSRYDNYLQFHEEINHIRPVYKKTSKKWRD